MQRILFVCLGNICRSAAAEGILSHKVRDAGLQQSVHIDSAGTSAYHIGEGADHRMQKAAARRGYRLESRSRRFVPEDFDGFDLILAMDRSNLRDIVIQDSWGRYGDRVRLLSDFISSESIRDIPDPFYGGKNGFDRVLDLLEEGTEGILDWIRDAEKSE